METLTLSKTRIQLHPAMTTRGPMTAQMNDVLRLPRPTLAALDPVMETVRGTTTPLTQPTGAFRNYLPAPTLRRDRRSLLTTT